VRTQADLAGYLAPPLAARASGCAHARGDNAAGQQGYQQRWGGNDSGRLGLGAGGHDGDAIMG